MRQTERKAILAIFLLAAFAASCALGGNRASADALEIYFLALLVVATLALGAAGLPPAFAKHDPRERSAGRLFVGAGLATLAYRVWIAREHAPSLWLDEDFQWRILMRLPPVAAGAPMYQPPLEMALERLWILAGGLSEISIRFNAMLFSSLATASMTALALLVTETILGGVAIGLLFTFHSRVENYGFEARPISLGLATLVLWLWTIWRTFNGRARDLRGWIHGCAAALLALLSLGMQPLFLLLALGCAASLWPGWRTGRKVWLLSQWVIAILLFLPIQLRILRFTRPLLAAEQHGGGADWARIARLAHEFRWENFRAPVALFATPIGVAIALGCVACATSAWRSRRRVRAGRSACWPRAGDDFGRFLALVALFFLGGLVPLFRVLVDYPLSEHYLIFAWPLACLALAGALREAGRQFGPCRTAFAVVSLACVTALLPGRVGQQLKQNYLGNLAAVWRPDFRGALTDVNRLRLSAGASVFSVCLNPRERYCPNWLVGSDLYLDRRPSRPDREGGSILAPPDDTLDWLPGFLSHEVNSPRELVLLRDNTGFGGDAISVPWVLEFAPFERRYYNRLDAFILKVDSRDPTRARTHLLALAEKLDRFATQQGVEEIGLLPLLILGNHAEGRPREEAKYLRLAKSRGALNDSRLRGQLSAAGIDLKAAERAQP